MVLSLYNLLYIITFTCIYIYNSIIGKIVQSSTFQRMQKVKSPEQLTVTVPAVV